MAAYSSFSAPQLEALCKVLGATDGGLTGTEIGRLLKQINIKDIDPIATKWKRLFAALANKQNSDKCSNNVLRFVTEAMDPVRFTSDHQGYESRRQSLNHVLLMCGYELAEDGKLRPAVKASTLSEAASRAKKLKVELQKRNVHPDVLTFCSEELVKDNYFHAVLEATKSVADKIRRKSGLSNDGGELAQAAFSLGKTNIPILAINTLRTDSEQSEQKGFANLLTGFFGVFRNPTAHAPKISWNMSEQDALDLLTMASYLHRRIDAAVCTKRS